MDETIDSLKIVIETEVKEGSTEKIKEFSKAIKGIKTATKDLDGKSLDAFSASMSKISGSMERLAKTADAVQSIKSLSGFMRSMSRIGNDGESFSKGVDTMAAALSRLESVSKTFNRQIEGIKNAGSAFYNIKAAALSLHGIEIPDDARVNLDRLATTVERASKVVSGLDALVRGLKNLKSAVDSASQTDPARLEQVAKLLESFSASLKGIDFSAGTGVKNISQGLKDLARIGGGDFNRLIDNLTNARVALEQFMKDLGKDITQEEMDRFKELSDALYKVADGYTKLAVARNAYANAPKGAKGDTAPATPNDGTQALMGNIAGSLGQLPFAGKFFGQLTSSANSMTAAFSAASKASGALGAALGPVAIGLAAVVAAVQGVQKYIQFINDQFNKMVGTLSKVAGAVKDVAVGAFEYLKGKLEGIGKSIEGFAKGIADAVKNISSFGKSVSKTLDKFSGSFFKNVEKGFKSLVNMVKRMALRKAINAIFKDINDSFENLVAFSRKYGTEFADSMDMFATSAKYLNNSIVAMVSPIINMVMPVFDKLVDKVVELMNAFNQLFTYFSGANEWTKAIKNAKKYGEEADKSSKKQKKLNNAILSFDEIHKLNGDNGKGKDFSTSDFEDWVFEIKTLDDLFDYLNEKLKGFLSNVKDYLDGIDWRQIKGVAYDLGEGIMKLLNSIFGDEGLAVRLGRSLAEVINTAFTFALGAVEEWDAQAWGRSFVAFFEGLFDNLDWTVIRMTFEEFGTKLAEYFNTIFSAEELFEKLGKTLSNGFNAVLSGVSNFVKDIDLKQFGIDLGITFRETFGNIDYSMLFTTLTTLLNKVFQALAGWVSESDLPGVVDKIGTGLVEGLKNISWTDIRQGVLGFVEDIDESINALFGNSELMSEIGKNIANGINTIKTAIASFWEGLDAEKVGGGIGTFIDSYFDTRNLEGKLMHLTELPQKILRIVAEAFKNIHTADLGKRIGEGLTNAIKNINLDQIGTDLSTISVKIGEFFGELFDNVSFKDLGEKLSGLGKKIVAAIAKMMNEVDWAEVGSDLAKGVNTLVTDFTEDEDNLGNASSIIDNISTFIGSLVDNLEWDKIQSNLETFLEKLPLEKLWSVLTEIVIRFWQTKREVATQWISDQIQGIFSGVLDTLSSEDGLGGNIAEHLFGGVPEWIKILGFDESLKYDIENFFENLDIELPEFDFDISDTLGVGLSDITRKVKEITQIIVGSLKPAVDVIKNAFDTIKSAAKKIYNYIKNVVEEIEDSDLGEVISSGSVLLGGAAGYVTNKVKNHATGMQGGVILNRGTVFGMDGDTRLVGGEAGKEAVVGVGSLSTMIQSSVLGAMSPMSMSTAVEAGVRSAMQGGGTSPVVDVTLKCDSETLFRMVKQGQTAYNGRYHFVEDFA